uniref:Uncharacterized protein n=1 Tax=Timema poppense TaxID=170557 RepID=A0A7R9HEH7_TIMPO|nr:unnamed protein product [Timema poppensis]
MVWSCNEDVGEYEIVEEARMDGQQFSLNKTKEAMGKFFRENEAILKLTEQFIEYCYKKGTYVHGFKSSRRTQPSGCSLKKKKILLMTGRSRSPVTRDDNGTRKHSYGPGIDPQEGVNHQITFHSVRLIPTLIHSAWLLFNWGEAPPLLFDRPIIKTRCYYYYFTSQEGPSVAPCSLVNRMQVM